MAKNQTGTGSDGQEPNQNWKPEASEPFFEQLETRNRDQNQNRAFLLKQCRNTERRTEILHFKSFPALTATGPNPVESSFG